MMGDTTELNSFEVFFLFFYGNFFLLSFSVFMLYIFLWSNKSYQSIVSLDCKRRMRFCVFLKLKIVFSFLDLPWLCGYGTHYFTWRILSTIHLHTNRTIPLDSESIHVSNRRSVFLKDALQIDFYSSILQLGK